MKWHAPLNRWTVAVALLFACGTASSQADDKPAAGPAGPSSDEKSTPAGASADAGDANFDPVAYFQTSKQAQRLLEEKKWHEAAELYRTLTEQYPDDGQNWVERGSLAMRLKAYPEAADCFAKAYELGFGRRDRTAYRLACAYAAQDDTEQAFAWLETAFAERLDNLFFVRVNTRLENIRDDKRFQKMMHLPPKKDLSRDERWRFDLSVLVTETRRMHRNLYHTMTPEQFDDAMQALDERIGELTDEQILVEMQKIIAMIRDGHSSVRTTRQKLTVSRIPLRFYLFSDGMYVIDATEPYKQWIGSEVIKIADRPTAEALEATEAIVSRDNPMGIKAAGPVYLRMPHVLQSLGLTEDSRYVPLVLRDRAGEEHAINVEPGPSEFSRRLNPSRLEGAPPAPRHLKDTSNPYWLEELADEKAVYVQFNAVRDKREEPLAEFSRRLRERLDTGDVQTLIVDVRHNGGGNTYLTIPLLRTLIYFETSRNDAQLYVIIGRATFSACQNFVTDVERLTDAVFVGEPTGSRPNSYGESTNVILPFSGVRASISSLRWQHGYPTDARIWIAPDIPAELSSRDYFANRDPALGALLRMIRGGGESASAEVKAGD